MGREMAGLDEKSRRNVGLTSAPHTRNPTSIIRLVTAIALTDACPSRPNFVRQRSTTKTKTATCTNRSISCRPIASLNFGDTSRACATPERDRMKSNGRIRWLSFFSSPAATTNGSAVFFVRGMGSSELYICIPYRSGRNHIELLAQLH